MRLAKAITGISEARKSIRFLHSEKLIADFQRDIARWNNENSHA